MTQAEIKLSSLLLQEHFGEIVEKIGTFLIRTGPQPLRLIVSETGLLLDQQVKKALCVLIQHNLVSYQLQKRGFVEYEAQCRRVLRILRYPRYIYTAKTLYSDTGELLVEELLLNGQMTMSALVRKVADRLTETMEDGKVMEYSEVCSTFVRLADTHFVQRCPMVPETPETPKGPPPPAPTLVINEKDMYLVPRLSLVGKGKRRRSGEEEEEEAEHKAKRLKQDEEGSEPPPDDGIYWQVNLERFHQHFRDQAIVSAVANRMDQVWGSLQRPAGASQCPAGASQHPAGASQCPAGASQHPAGASHLSLLPPPQLEFVGKSGDSGGGMFTVSILWEPSPGPAFSSPFPSCSWFGSRCARIFRLLLRKRHLEQKQVEDFAMIPAKEAKEMLYKLLSQNFVALQEIPKTPDHAPSRTFYLYTVSVASTARMLLHRCYKSVANLIERRQYETRENKRLLEKSQRVEAILASMQATGAEATQLQEIEEMITAPERQQLETLKRNVNKIDASENQVDETIFVLESFIESTAKRP
ncbi:RPC3 polymerase, partial [Tricholaema leucomelas]|nr:RPC3 polymerase [Tricholaema leucomelas]